jgi:hypothetical protein
MHHATVAAGLVHRDGVFLLDDLDADAWVPLLQAVCDGQTQHPRTDDPHSLPAHGAPSGSVFPADGRLQRVELTWTEFTTYPADEIAVRFHHRLVFTHPFPSRPAEHATGADGRMPRPEPAAEEGVR